MSKKQEPDDKRSFPGYGSADSVFVSWANTLRAQASSWNDLWIKLRAGSAEFGDWTKLWVESAEAFMSLSEQFWYTFSGSAAPPWVTLRLPAKDAVPVRILKAVDPKDSIEPVALTRLGAHQPDQPLLVRVSVKGVYDLSVSVDDVNLQEFLSSNPEEAQYIGLVFSHRHPDPIAIVNFVVSPAELKQSQLVNENRQHVFGPRQE
jgi:hypothetical protein